MTPLPVLLAQQTEAPAPPVLPPANGGGDATTTTQPGGQGQTGAPAGGQGGSGGGGPGFEFLILILAVVLLYVFMFSGQRKKDKQRKALLAALKKGDRVQMIGGELGTIMEVRDDEVVVKVDESSNTRIRYARNAVAAVTEAKSD